MKQFQINFTDMDSFRSRLKEFGDTCQKAGMSNYYLQIFSEDLGKEKLEESGGQ